MAGSHNARRSPFSPYLTLTILGRREVVGSRPQNPVKILSSTKSIKRNLVILPIIYWKSWSREPVETSRKHE